MGSLLVVLGGFGLRTAATPSRLPHFPQSDTTIQLPATAKVFTARADRASRSAVAASGASVTYSRRCVTLGGGLGAPRPNQGFDGDPSMLPTASPSAAVAQPAESPPRKQGDACSNHAGSSTLEERFRVARERIMSDPRTIALLRELAKR